MIKKRFIKNFFKKSLSLAMAVLMVLSCWVWIVPEHSHAVVYTDIEAVKSTNSTAINGITINTDDITTVRGKFPSDADNLTDADYNNVYHNVLYIGDVGAVASEKLEYESSCTGNNGATVTWYYPEATLLYDGDKSNFPRLGVAIGVKCYASSYTANSRNYSSWISSNGNGFSLTEDWRGNGAQTALNFQWLWNSNSGIMGYYEGDNDKNWQLKGNTNECFAVNLLRFNAENPNFGNEYYITAKPTFKMYGDNTSKSKTFTGASNKTLCIINYLPLKTALKQANDILTTAKGNLAGYTTDSVSDLAKYAKALVAAMPNNYINSSKNDYSGWNTAAKKAVSDWNTWCNGNTTTGGLVEIKKITWKVENVETVEYYGVGSTPTKTAPQKASEGYKDETENGKGWQYTYTFDGWIDSKDGNLKTKLPSVTEDATYTAQFTKNTNFYVVTFDLSGDRADITKLYTPNSTITDPPTLATREPDADNHYSYKWDKALATVTEDVTYTETLVTEKHSYGNWTTVEDATCNKDGKQICYCTVCNTPKEGAITERPNHEIEKVKDYKDSTCTEVGNITYYKCKNCNTLFKDEAGTVVITIEDTIIGMKDHVYGDPIVGSGNDDYHELKCNTCEDRKTQEHTYVPDYGSETEATCIVAGTSTETCAFCNRTKTIKGEKDPDNHVNKQIVGATEPTCDKNGYTGDTYCLACDPEQKNVITKGEVRPATGHKFDGAYVSNNNGTHVQKCTNKDCTATGNEKACTYGAWKDNKDGTHSHSCNHCGYTPEAENHIWGAWTPAADNTDKDPGKMTRSCTACSASETVDCTDYEVTSYTKADCVNDETTTYKCKDCGHTYTVIGTLASGHKFDGDYVSKNGTHVQKCTNADCTATGNEQACTYDAWKDNKDGTHSHSCIYCKYTPAAEKHIWSAWTPVDANASEKGKMTHSCTVCGREETTDCTYSEEYIDPTCTADAKTTYICSDCGHGYTEIHANTATGHKFDGEYKYDAETDRHQRLCSNGCGAYGIGTTADEWAACEWSYTNKADGKHIATCVCGNSEEQACTGGEATCTAKAVCKFCKTEYGLKSAHSFTGTAVALDGDYHAFRCKFCKDDTIYGVGSVENMSVPCLGGEATCTTRATCNVCNDYYGTVDENAHKWTGPSSNKDAEHTHTYTCEYDSKHKKTEACAPEIDSIVDSTCEEEGYTIQKCTLCSEKWNTDYKDALGHKWGAWLSNNDGKHTKTCERDDCCYGENGVAKTETAICSKDNATVVVTDPTCTEQGYSTYTCKLCDYNWDDDKVNANGHNYSSTIYKEEYLFEAQNCLHGNIYFYVCKDCHKNGKDETDKEKYTNLTFEVDGTIGHNWDEVIDEKYHASDVSCVTDEKYYKSCTVCKIASEETFTVEVAYGHTWVKPTDAQLKENEALTAVKPDCETDAQYYYVCETCAVSSKGVKTDGETWTVTNSDKPGRHSTMIAVEGVTGDCENDTILAHYYCVACGKKFEDAEGNNAFVGSTVIKAPGHKWITYKAVDATCEADGHNDYQQCEVESCKKVKGKVTIYKNTGHKFSADAGYYVDEVNGYHAFYCTNDKCILATDDNGAEIKDAKGRSLYNKAYGIVVDGEQVKYSVTDNGDGTVTVVGGIKCTFDNSTITTVNGVHSHNDNCVCGNAIRNVYEDASPETVAPSCTEQGYTLHECSACKATWKTDLVEANGHTWATTGISNGDGTHSLKCIVEGCTAKKDTVRCQGGEATCEKQAACSVCGGLYGETLEHTLSEDGWIYNNDAKCGVDGTETQECSVCGKDATRKKAGSALSHVYLAEYTYDITGWTNKPADFKVEIKEPDCKTMGRKINYCTNEGCSEYKIKDVPASAEYHNIVVTTVDGTCTTGATTTKRCTVCDFSETVVSEAADHKWREQSRSNPTCTQSGNINYICLVCNEKAKLNEFTADFTDSDYVNFKGMQVDVSGIKALGHSWGNIIVLKAATCSRKGEAEHTCDRCDITEKYDLEVIKGAHIIGSANCTLKRVPASEPTCKVPGNREYYECTMCPYSQNANDEYKLNPIDHKDENGDGRCDTCYEPMDKAVIDDGCICHKTGFSAFIYKILRIFWKLFKMKKTCDCGAVHY